MKYKCKRCGHIQIINDKELRSGKSQSEVINFLSIIKKRGKLCESCIRKQTKQAKFTKHLNENYHLNSNINQIQGV